MEQIIPTYTTSNSAKAPVSPGREIEAHLTYWQTHLSGAPALLELPTDRPRSSMHNYQGAAVTSRLSSELTSRLQELSEQEGAALFMTLLATFNILLSRYSGQEDIVVGSPVACPTPTESNGVIGFFVNTLALRTDLSGDPRFRLYLEHVRDVCLDAYAHQDLPFETLIAHLHPEQDGAHAPLTRVYFHQTARQADVSDLPSSFLSASQSPLTWDLALEMIDTGDGLTAMLEYNAELFDASTMESMLDHFAVLLEGVVEDPDSPISHLHLLTRMEQQQLLVEFNATQTSGLSLPLHQRFQQQAERTPQATALVFQEQQLTYQELNARANQLAHWLREQAVGPDTLVGLYLHPSLEMIVGMLGILKAGAAYLPLDPLYPQERLQFMLADSQATLLLTQQALSHNLTDFAGKRLCLDTEWETLAVQPPTNPDSVLVPEHLAYVIYTSGSTGKPKGVMIPHRGLSNYLDWAVEAYEAEAGAGSPVHSSMGFDLTVTSLFPALLAGRKVHLLASEAGVEGLGKVLSASPGFSLVKLTPAHLELLAHQVPAEAAASAARRFVVGGEALLGEQLAFWRTHAPDLQIVNEYGPTETTVGCCVYSLPAGACPESGALAIGSPIANTQLYVLDRHLNPVGMGVSGELYIGGEGLARGYLSRPDLTAERFVPDAFSQKPGARLYRTGDLVKYLPDGQLMFLGRLDHQVKIRGFRIELGEIEAALREHPGIQEALVLAREDIAAEKRLVAYLIGKEGVAVGWEELRGFLKARLPEYMLPSAWVWMEAFPLTHNGKVDLNALPAPVQARSGLSVGQSTDRVAPRNTTEAQLCALWEQALGMRTLSVLDSFWDLGGTSLTAARLFQRIHETFQRELPLSVLIQSPTIADLATILRETDSDKPASSLVLVKPGDARRPFFWVHGAGANIVHLGRIARYIDPDQTLYGLQAQGLDGKREPFKTVQEMATHYISEIKVVQPHGPYLLGGLSFGGLIAFEMSQQLLRQGETVQLLVLLDTNYPQREKMLPNHLWVFQKRIYPFVEALETKITDLKRSGIPAFLRKRGAAFFKGFTARGRKPANQGTLRNAELAANLSPTLQKVWKTNVQAERRYVPSVYPGRVTLFYATGWSLTEIMRQPDQRLRWCEMAGGGLEVYTVPGDHAEVRHEEAICAMVARLNHCLAQAHEALECEKY